MAIIQRTADILDAEIEQGATFDFYCTLYTGLLVVIKLTNANTGAATLNINSLGAKALKVKGSDPADNAFDANGYYMFVYDGTNFEQVDPA